MKKLKIFNFLTVLFIIYFIIPTNAMIKYKNTPVSKICKKIETTALKESERGYSVIKSYLAGENVSATKLKDGSVKIPLNREEYVLIPFKNNLEIFLKRSKPKLTKSPATVKFAGEVSRPGYPVSNTVCAPKTGPLQHSFTVSSSFSYELKGSAGISISKFEAVLGTTLKRDVTISETYSYKIPKDRCGTVYGSETYNKYIYEKKRKVGPDKKATLLEPSSYLLYVIIR